MSNRYAKACTPKRAANDSGLRRATSIRCIVIHSAEAFDSFGEDLSAEGVAGFFARSSTEASTQLAVDRDSCMRMVPDLVIPWGASGANSDGLHVEICGTAKWSRSEWLRRRTMLRRAAFKVARWCWLYDIPARWLSDRQLANGTARGLTTHVQVNKVFKRGHHWDPGPGFPKDVFLGYVAEYLAQIAKERER
ncbi:MAG: N-acetylmuramoyl-L-alanine amidase [Actinomycetota bacterium]|nr:N-acetylmuramoyl-L-alanine amidase [Actinomycetota bacterium]